jgi:hypothetical protein
MRTGRTALAKAGVVTAVLLGALYAAPASYGAGWLSADNVSGPFGTGLGSCSPCLTPRDGVWIDANSAGKAVAIWSIYDDGPNTATVQAATRPLGGSWSSPTTLSSTGIQLTSPHVAVAPDGSAVAVWVERITGSDVAVAAAMAPNGTWSSSQALSLGTVYAEDPRIRMDGGGNAVAAWIETRNDPAGVVAYAERPAGGSWGARVPIAAPDTEDVQLAVNAAGAVLLVWNVDNGSYRVARQMSRPAGGSFGGTSDLTNTTSEPNPDVADVNAALDSAGNRFAIWAYKDTGSGLRRAITRVGPPTGPFTGANHVLDTAPLTSDVLDPAIALDPQGNATASWEIINNPPPTVDLRTATLPAGGAWSAPGPIASVAGVTSDPELRVNTGGEALAIFRRDVFIATGVLQFATRPFGGSWAAPQDLSGDTIVDDPRIAMDAQGHATVIFATDNGSTLAVQSRVYDPVAPTLSGVQIPGNGTVGQALNFSVTATDAWTPSPTVSWNFGDGQTAEGPSVSHAFNAGTFNVTVTATDSLGNASSASGTVQVPATLEPFALQPPQPTVLRLLGKSVKGTTARLQFRCTGAPGATCPGRVDLSTVKRMRGTKLVGLQAAAPKVKRKRVATARKSFVLKTGETRTVNVPLNASAKTLLKRFKRLPVKLTITLRLLPKPTVVSSGTLAFKATPKPKPKR